MGEENSVSVWGKSWTAFLVLPYAYAPLPRAYKLQTLFSPRQGTTPYRIVPHLGTCMLGQRSHELIQGRLRLRKHIQTL